MENAEESKQPEKVESIAKKENDSNKGILNLADCNLIHQLITRGFAIDGSVEHLVTTFNLLGAFNTNKNVPSCSIILNRNLSMDKGINKIIKTIAAVSANDDPMKGGEFMVKHIPVGMLNASNVTSLFKFLTKQATSESEEKEKYVELLETLMGEKFFLKHLTNSSASQKHTFKQAVEDSRYKGAGQIIDHMNYIQNNPAGRAETEELNDPKDPQVEHDELLD